MTSVHARPILIMAGGTGGHVFPALALARLLRAKSFEVVWLGTQRGLEARGVPAERIQIEWLPVGGLGGKGVSTVLAAPFRPALALMQALRVMVRHPAHVLDGVGVVCSASAGCSCGGRAEAGG